jgi:hypothetical protein
MGLFSGDSSSSSKTENVDQRLFQESGAVGASASGNGTAVIYNLDGGAISASFGLGAHALDSLNDLATSALSGAHHTAELALNGALASVEDSKDAFNKATQQVSSAYADAKVGDRTQMMLLGVVAIAVIGLAIASGRMKA